MNKAIGILSILAFIVVVLSAITWNHNRSMELQNNKNLAEAQEETEVTETVSDKEESQTIKKEEQTVDTEEPQEEQNVKDFNLIAKETQTQIAPGVTLPVWTYGGTIPGTEIRVTEGDYVKVHVTNQLDVPITIHWHGYPVTSDMDGVPGFTQDAILPGQSYTYEFKADVPGTYWYHSHQESSKQVDKGLYGALVVLPKDKLEADEDYTLILDEWAENGEGEMTMSSESSDMQGMGNEMDTSSQSNGDMDSKDLELQEEQMMKELYNIYTVNGKSGDLIEPLAVKKGDTVRLRFINAGYRSHGIHIPGQNFKVVSLDGQDIKGAEEIKDQIILIAPGERYDIEFTVNTDEDFIIDFHDDNLYNEQLKIPVKVSGGNGILAEEDSEKELPYFDFMNYGTYSTGEFTMNQRYDIDENIELNADSKDGTLIYTINGKTYQELSPITVKTGDTVKIIYENKGKVDHPIHLHGHFFQVLSKNDTPYMGAPIMKDTLLIKPGEKYVIAFKADNPGNWIYHCHELHHAAAGMMQKVIYSDYKSSYIPDPNNQANKPE
ncbi:multicopper oxidase family protein [Anaerocolumna chitinilytica]|uniref:Copper oxidase n=1 Tax=Anaerocolumna chitinilytica TaxID=1727145 RepID=A0A7I8DJD3_9FIRM|nr:multicopper oxidase family protein [Anaerocolumna chitinilytica]BCJ98432.1 copper oxidase [Anaerocolumna chitinilytica]